MAQLPLPPPPLGADPTQDRWLNLLWKRINASGQILWSYLDFTGSNLTDLATRNHADLQNINTSSYTHLTSTQATDLTDGGETVLHSHASPLITNTAATLTVAADTCTVVQTTAASVYTLPAAASYANRRLHIVTQFAGTITSAASNVVPIAGGAAGTAILAATAGKWATLQSDGTNWIIIAAN